MRSLAPSRLAALAALLVLAAPVHAQDARTRPLFAMPTGVGAELGSFPRGAPGTGTGSPIAFGVNLHDFYLGIGYQTPVRYGSVPDASGVIGFGLGDSKSALGFDLSVANRW